MYTFDRTLPNTGIDEAIARTRKALADQGFGVLTEIDVKKTLKAKIGAEVDDYVILGACNPKMAHEAMKLEPRIGAMLPCNVIVRATNGGIEVSAIDPSPRWRRSTIRSSRRLRRRCERCCRLWSPASEPQEADSRLSGAARRRVAGTEEERDEGRRRHDHRRGDGGPGTSVSDVAKLMLDRRISGVPVVDVPAGSSVSSARAT